MLVILYPFSLQLLSAALPENPILGNSHFVLSVFLVLYILGSAVIFLGILRVNRCRFRDFWRGTSFSLGEWLSELCVLLACLFGATFFSSVLLHLFGIDDQAILPIGMPAQYASLRDPLFLVIYLLVMPLVEETCFRGVLLRTLGRYGNRFAIVTISLIFALLHGSPAEYLPCFLLSVVLCRLTLLHHSIFPTIFLRSTLGMVFLGLAAVPEQYSFYVGIAILLLYLLVAFLLVSHRYRPIRVRPSANTKELITLFFGSPGVILALLLLVLKGIFYIWLA